MTISKLVKTLIALSVVLGLVTTSIVYYMGRSLDEQRLYTQEQYEFQKIGYDLSLASDLLTREARLYAVTGNKEHHNHYWQEVTETKTREKAIERLHQIGTSTEEMDLLDLAKENSDKLVFTEYLAMEAVKAGDLEKAQHYMFDQSYSDQQSLITQPIDEFRKIINTRVSEKLEDTSQQMRMFVWFVTSAVFLYAMLVFYVLHFIIDKKISHPLAGITEAISTIAAGDTQAVIPYTEKACEIGDLARAAGTFKDSLKLNKDLQQDLERHKSNLEVTVAKRTEDLKSANDELEEFAYRTSHDLRSPIISSSRLLSMVEDSLKAGKLDEALPGLEHAKNSLIKLETLIKDMLVLAEAKGKAEETELVDFEKLTSAALDKMMHMEDFDCLRIDKEFIWTGELHSKRTRINMVLENLLSNAIKYQDKSKDAPYIKVSTRELNGFVLLEVEDNGLGIPEEQQEKLFNMFQRFHPKVSFGSGLGLYLLKKCAEKVNGEISYAANPAEGGGSIFRLSIPINVAAAA